MLLSSSHEFRFQLCKLLQSHKMGRMEHAKNPQPLNHFPRMEEVGDASAEWEALPVGPAVGP